MQTIWGNLFNRRNENQDNLKKILHNILIFQDLTDRELTHIERILYRRTYQAGEVIFREGEPGLGMYIIEQGLVDITLATGNERLAELCDGDFFGELSLLDDSARTATATAREDCRMLCFFQPELMDLLNVSPRLGVKVLLGLSRTLGERLKRANEYIQLLKSVDSGMPEHSRTNA